MIQISTMEYVINKLLSVGLQYDEILPIILKMKDTFGLANNSEAIEAVNQVMRVVESV